MKFNVSLISGIYILEENKPEEDVHGSFTLCGEDNCGWAVFWVLQWFKSAWFSQQNASEKISKKTIASELNSGDGDWGKQGRCFKN